MDAPLAPREPQIPFRTRSKRRAMVMTLLRIHSETNPHSTFLQMSANCVSTSRHSACWDPAPPWRIPLCSMTPAWQVSLKSLKTDYLTYHQGWGSYFENVTPLPLQVHTYIHIYWQTVLRNMNITALLFSPSLLATKALHLQLFLWHHFVMDYCAMRRVAGGRPT